MDVHSDASSLLASEKIVCKRVVAVDVDSVLYITPDDQPRTAWLDMDPVSHAVNVHVVAGFVAEREVRFETRRTTNERA